MGGFIGIGNIFPDVWDWQRFWMLTAFLSVALGFMNVLPIPALDGGHAVFAIYEIIKNKYMQYTQAYQFNVDKYLERANAMNGK